MNPRSRIRPRSGVTSTVVVILLLLLLLAMIGCGAKGKGESTASEKSDTGKDTQTDVVNDDTSSDPTDSGSTDSGGTDMEDPAVQEIISDTQTVITQLNEYYAKAVPNYKKPTALILYVSNEGLINDGGTVGPDYPGCGTDKVSGDNAFFCPADNTVIAAIDFLLKQQQNIGDSFTYLAFAHEYGHSAQYNLDYQKDPNADNTELQADCYAGAFLQYELDNNLLQEEEGDEEESNQSLAAISGHFGSTDNHGTLAERSTAFEFGRKNDASACESEYA